MNQRYLRFAVKIMAITPILLCVISQQIKNPMALSLSSMRIAEIVVIISACIYFPFGFFTERLIQTFASSSHSRTKSKNLDKSTFFIISIASFETPSITAFAYKVLGGTTLYLYVCTAITFLGIVFLRKKYRHLFLSSNAENGKQAVQ